MWAGTLLAAHKLAYVTRISLRDGHTAMDSFTSFGRLESFSAAAVDEYRAKAQLARDERNAAARRPGESRKAIALSFFVVSKNTEGGLVAKYRAVNMFCRSRMTPISRRKTSYRLANRIRRDVMYHGRAYVQRALGLCPKCYHEMSHDGSEAIPWPCSSMSFRFFLLLLLLDVCVRTSKTSPAFVKGASHPSPPNAVKRRYSVPAQLPCHQECLDSMYKKHD